MDLLAIVAFVEAQMLSAARAPGARQWKTVERLEEKFLIVGVGAARSHFVIRQHATTLHGELEGRRKKAGRIETGMVYEQTMRIADEDGQVPPIRRITVKLDEPTRDGDTEMHVLTNLPSKVSARQVASLDQQRWKIETAFQELAENLQGEINTLGYPKAALFGFCLAWVSYHLLSIMKAAVSAAHGEEEAAKLSTYLLCRG